MKIRLTESKLKQIVEESVRNILKEGYKKIHPIDIPFSERTTAFDGYQIPDEYLDYANRVSTEYEGKGYEIADAWKKYKLKNISDRADAARKLDKQRCLNVYDERCLKPHYPIQTEEELDKYWKEIGEPYLE